jgi:UDP-N-acetylglucosamine enolpyruvyl transferase
MAGKKEETKETNKTPREEEIGFHKGALTTLAKERQEFVRLLGVVEQLMKLHINALKKLGVDLEKEAEEIHNEEKKEKKEKKPLDEVL